MKKPNIILILTDNQGYGDLGRHGNPEIVKTMAAGYDSWRESMLPALEEES